MFVTGRMDFASPALVTASSASLGPLYAVIGCDFPEGGWRGGRLVERADSTAPSLDTDALGLSGAGPASTLSAW